MDTQELLPELNKAFEKCEMLEGKVARCEHRYEGKLRSVVFVKAVDDLPLIDELNELQAEVVAPSYFATSDESRWNHYLILVTSQERFKNSSERRLKIEANTSYARKVVLAKEQLKSFLDRKVMIGSSGTSIANALQQTWSEILSRNFLAAVDSEEHRTTVIKAIRRGDRPTVARAYRAVQDTQPAAFLKHFDVRKFGGRKTAGRFNFSRVNLIRGVNGSGKTSLLEAIEHFFCGGTARANGSEALDASATFSGHEREVQYQQRQPSYYIQRDLKWYGRKVSNRNRLFDGFARYNFLSADAAVDFSREREQHDLKEVLSRVALGPNASATWTRISQFIADIEPQLGQLNKDILAIKQRLDTDQTRLSIIDQPSPEDQSRADHVNKLLQGIGWPVESLPDSLSVEFSGLASIRVLLESIPDPIPGSEADARRELDHIRAQVKEVSELEESVRTTLASIHGFEHSVKNLESLTRALTRLSDYQSSGFYEAYIKANALSHEGARVADRTILVSTRDLLAQTIADGEELIKLPISDLALQLDNRSAELRKKVDEHEAEIKAALSLTEYKSTLTAQLRSIGLELIQDRDTDHCPLCRTSMAHEELVLRVESLLVDYESADFARLDSERDKLMDQLSVLLQLVSNLHGLVSIDAGLGELSIPNGVERVDKQTAEERLRTAERESFLRTLQELEVRGFGIEEFNGLIARCVNELGGTFEVLPLANGIVAAAVEELGVRLRASNAELAKLRGEKSELEASVVSRLTSLAGSQDASVARTAIAERTASLRNFIQAFEALPMQVRNLSSDKLYGFVEDAKVVYRQIQSLSEDIRTAQAKQREVALLVAGIQSATSEVSKLISERDNLQKAFSVLENIKEHHSLDDGVSAFLNDNLASIQSIFQKIHVPNELRMCDLAKSQLVRLDGGRDAPLNQISTGQRAALVLSIFLTLNMSLRSGPPIMLVDDPISHIDDLNSLAFLDYLADIAESGHRQIFFATADEKIANLFEKKMAFLGEELTVVPLARESEPI